MGLIQKPYTFQNDTLADASEVNENFDVLYAEINGKLDDANLGNRTVDDGTPPGSNTGTVTSLLSGLANRIKAITGKATWRDDPDHPLTDLETKTGAQQKADEAQHAAEEYADQAASNAKQAANTYTDQATSSVQSALEDSLRDHKNDQGAHGAVSSATANRIVRRDSSGRARFADPSHAQDAANKRYVDEAIPKIALARGTLNHGEFLPVIPGYTRSQCHYMVSPFDIEPGWYGQVVNTIRRLQVGYNPSDYKVFFIYEDAIGQQSFGKIQYLVIGVK